MSKVSFDTNVLLDHPEVLDSEEYTQIVLPSAVLEEIDGLKNSTSVGHLAREVHRKLEENLSRITFDVSDDFSENMPMGWDREKRDNKIIMCALKHNVKLISNDINVRIKAQAVGVEFEGYGDNKKISKLDDYCGYKTIELSHEELAKFYEKNIDADFGFGLLNGQYLLIKDVETQEIVDKYKYVNGDFKKLKYKQLSTKTIGKVKPINLQQELLFDLLQDDTKTIFASTGKQGTGKDYLMLAHAFDMIERRKFDQLLFCRNNIEVKDSKEIGFLKGSLVQKLMPYCQVIADHVGGQIGLDMLIAQGVIELQHLGFLRGRTIKNSIIYVTEAENMTREHIKLLLGRVGDGSIIMFNGDLQQIDHRTFELNNGLNALVDVLKGNDKFGIVRLEKTERSETAALADLF
jgi:PhoH-like ATPase